jgi:hypothetical protein
MPLSCAAFGIKKGRVIAWILSPIVAQEIGAWALHAMSNFAQHRSKIRQVVLPHDGTIDGALSLIRFVLETNP